MAVHSKRLGSSIAVGATDVTLYTVPSGKRTIVKGVQMQNLGATACRGTLKVYNGATQIMQYATPLAAVGSDGNSDTRQIWLVMNAGEALKCNCTAGTIVVCASGAELTL